MPVVARQRIHVVPERTHARVDSRSSVSAAFLPSRARFSDPETISIAFVADRSPATENAETDPTAISRRLRRVAARKIWMLLYVLKDYVIFLVPRYLFIIFSLKFFIRIRERKREREAVS